MKFRIVYANYPYTFDVWKFTEDLSKKELRLLLLTVFLRHVEKDSDDVEVTITEVANKMNIEKTEAYQLLKELERLNWLCLEWLTKPTISEPELPDIREFAIIEIHPEDFLKEEELEKNGHVRNCDNDEIPF